MPGATEAQKRELQYLFNDLQIGSTRFDAEGNLTISVNPHITRKQLVNLTSYLEDNDLEYKALQDDHGTYTLKLSEKSITTLAKASKAFAMSYLNKQFHDWHNELSTGFMPSTTSRENIGQKGFLLATKEPNNKAAFLQTHIDILSESNLGHKAVYLDIAHQKDIFYNTVDYQKEISDRFNKSHFQSRTFLEIVADFFKTLFNFVTFNPHYADKNKREVHLIPVSPLTLLTDPSVYKEKFQAKNEQLQAETPKTRGTLLKSVRARKALRDVPYKGLPHGSIKMDKNLPSAKVVRSLEHSQEELDKTAATFDLPGFSKMITAATQNCNYRITFYNTAKFKKSYEDSSVTSGLTSFSKRSIDLPAHVPAEFSASALAHEAGHVFAHLWQHGDNAATIIRQSEKAQRNLEKFFDDHKVINYSGLMRYLDLSDVDPEYHKKNTDPKLGELDDGSEWFATAAGLMVALKHNEEFVSAYNDPDNHELDDFREFMQTCSQRIEAISRNTSPSR